MKKYIIQTLLFSIVLLIASCDNDGYEQNEQGLQYKFIRDQEGEKIVEGNIVQLHLTYLTLGDSLLYDSKVIGDSFIIKVSKPVFEGGFEDALMLMGEGDSAEFLLSADSVYQLMFHQPRPAALAAGSWIKFRVGVNKVMTEKEFADKIRKDYARQQQDQINAIEKYLAENGIQIKASSPGIYFVVLKEGPGKIPAYGDSVEVKYTGKTLEGRIFDSSSKAGGNLSFRVGSGRYLDAWERAITSMKTGSLARLVLTSDQAFGKSDKGPVPADTPVVFDLELLHIKSLLDIK